LNTECTYIFSFIGQNAKSVVYINHNYHELSICGDDITRKYAFSVRMHQT